MTLFWRGMLATLFWIHWVKLNMLLSQQRLDYQVSSYYYSFMSFMWSHGSKKTSFALLHFEKMDDAILLFEYKMHWVKQLKRPCLNELQKEYCMKIKLIALDWQWVTLISWCQMNYLGHSSPVMHNVEGKTLNNNDNTPILHTCLTLCRSCLCSIAG